MIWGGAGRGRFLRDPKKGHVCVFLSVAPAKILTPDVGRASTVAPLTPAPAQSSLGNPWAATRERMSSATLQVEGACPTSAGLSETSTLPVQRSMGMQSVGAGSVISAQACPMTGVGGSYPYFQPPLWPRRGDRSGTGAPPPSGRDSKRQTTHPQAAGSRRRPNNGDTTDQRVASEGLLSR